MILGLQVDDSAKIYRNVLTQKFVDAILSRSIGEDTDSPPLGLYHEWSSPQLHFLLRSIFAGAHRR